MKSQYQTFVKQFKNKGRSLADDIQHGLYLTRKPDYILRDERGEAVSRQDIRPLMEARNLQCKNGITSFRLSVGLPLDTSRHDEAVNEILTELNGRYSSFLYAVHADDPNNPHMHMMVFNDRKLHPMHKMREVFSLQDALERKFRVRDLRLSYKPKAPGEPVRGQAEEHIADSWKENIRAACILGFERAKTLEEFEAILSSYGVRVARETANSLTLQDAQGMKCRLSKLFSGMKNRIDIENRINHQQQNPQEEDMPRMTPEERAKYEREKKEFVDRRRQERRIADAQAVGAEPWELDMLAAINAAVAEKSRTGEPLKSILARAGYQLDNDRLVEDDRDETLTDSNGNTATAGRLKEIEARMLENHRQGERRKSPGEAKAEQTNKPAAGSDIVTGEVVQGVQQTAGGIADVGRAAATEDAGAIAMSGGRAMAGIAGMIFRIVTAMKKHKQQQSEAERRALTDETRRSDNAAARLRRTLKDECKGSQAKAAELMETLSMRPDVLSEIAREEGVSLEALTAAIRRDIVKTQSQAASFSSAAIRGFAQDIRNSQGQGRQETPGHVPPQQPGRSGR